MELFAPKSEICVAETWRKNAKGALGTYKTRKNALALAKYTQITHLMLLADHTYKNRYRL